MTTVEVARTVEDVRALSHAWPAFGGPDAGLDLFLCLARIRAEIVRPHVIVARDEGGAVVGALVARLEDKRLPARFGYATILAPRVRCLTVVCGGVAGDATTEERLVGELLAALARREADVVVFHRAVVGSTVHALATSRPGALARERFASAEPHWVFDLPERVEDLQAALPRSVRENLGRYSRRLARQHGDRMEIRRYDAAQDAGAAVRDLEAIAATTYQRGLGAGFDAARDRDVVELGLRQGWYRAWVLYLDGAPVAFELGMVHDGTFVLGAKGYDPAHSRLHPGKAVQLRVLEDLCADPAVRTYDFGFGDADYKRRLATRGWEDADVLVYGRTARARLAHAGRTAVVGADRLARRAAGRERVAWVKRRWRTLRTPGGAGSPA
ncbi:MAG: hypothetical protein QOC78_3554 [Solirubrobacteraceae bacterium]|nr:hypothetical protein [Solirubrobacteraceae bacterium]